MPLPLTGTPVIPMSKMAAYLLKENPGRPELANVAARIYYDMGPRLSQRADVVMCEMILETGHGTSWESQYPRYNFAGVGVSGTIISVSLGQRPAPVPGNDWSYDPTRGWVQGLVYWHLTLGVLGHMFHLLTWMKDTAPDSVTTYFDRRSQVTYDHRVANKIPAARTTADLGGPGRWAEDPDYAAKIDAIYNTILNWRQF